MTAYSRREYYRNQGVEAWAGKFLHSIQRKDTPYEKYLKGLSQNNRHMAEQCLLGMVNLYLSGYEDYLLVQSAGNGVDNGKGEGLDALVSSFFASVTASTYETLSTRLSKEMQEKLKAAGGYPFFSQRILIVGSVKNKKNQNGYYEMADSSNYGGQVDICAPGVEIYSTVLNNSYENKNGTSMAAPEAHRSAGHPSVCQSVYSDSSAQK